MRILLVSTLMSLFLLACQHRTANESSTSAENYAVREAPHSAVPPPPPPSIEEAANEEMEEAIEFVDQAVETEMPYDQEAGNWEAITREEYAPITENAFKSALNEPLSTFSIDVDQASYSNCRRYLNQGVLPPPNAVRIEEFINYFDYDYPQAKDGHPFTVSTEISDCPWAKGHKLAHIGIQGKTMETSELPPSNLVFLLDVSGSMSDYNKLPLLKKAFKLLVQQLRAKDRVAIVVYAGASGVVLPSTKGNDKRRIFEALDRLKAGGGTAGAAGIQLAYQLAESHLMPGGNNRVILATDGDFNIGMSSNDQMKSLIESKRDQGIFLSVLGFGMGNYKDSKMEILADHGNGNYAYIDNLQEARKVLVEGMTGTIFTIAKDVKLQLEFNPSKVKSYRLIGYENRTLANEDFDDDQKDAGELGAGHTVTALYEIIPADAANASTASTDHLKYQDRRITEAAKNDPDWMTVKLRYKHPKETQSQLIVKTASDRGNTWANSSDNFRFSAAVAGFGLLLRNSAYKGNLKYDQVSAWIVDSMGKDKFGYRKELLNLVKTAERVDDRSVVESD
ncbi:MAG: VWA domain-containing protein [Bacteroidota bacterium]